VIGAAELETNCLQLLLCHRRRHAASQQTGVENRLGKLKKRFRTRLSLAPLRIHTRTGSSALICPFLPPHVFVNVHPSERWLAGRWGSKDNQLNKACVL